jgi:DNA polymerase-3 subunit gamma/tau
MSLSLYNKYRPETFADVVGQEHIETTLRNAVTNNMVSHAYLFTGPRGTGKTTTARLLAKALLCEQAPTDHPDGTCDSCREIAEGIHPDVFELDAASRTGVENVREEIIGRVNYTPTRGAYKIYIIDEVHMLTGAAFNALLKTVEEPPTHVIFVLCTTEANKVPQTIRSRCQSFDFHRLSEAEITGRLRWIAEQEGFTIESEALDLIAKRSLGGMRDAIGSLEQIAVFGEGVVSFEAARSMLGEVAIAELFSVADLIATRDIAGCFAWVASFTQGGTDLAQLVRDLTVHIRNLYVALAVSADAAAELLGSDGASSEAYAEQAARFGSTDRLAYALVVLGDLSSQLRTSANARLALEIALARLTRPGSDLSLESLADRIAVLEQGGYAAPAATPAEQQSPGSLAEVAVIDRPELEQSLGSGRAMRAPTTNVGAVIDCPEQAETVTPPSADQPLTSESAGRLWNEVDRKLNQLRKLRLATLLGGSKAHLDPVGQGLIIELPPDAALAKDTLENPENKSLLIGLLTELSGRELTLAFTLGVPAAKTEKGNKQDPRPVSQPQIDEPQTAPITHQNEFDTSPFENLGIDFEDIDHLPPADSARPNN